MRVCDRLSCNIFLAMKKMCKTGHVKCPRDSGKRRRSWRTQKYLLPDTFVFTTNYSCIYKSFSEANYILKMGKTWRSFWYAGIIILLLSRHQPKKLATWLKIQNSSQNWEDNFCGSSKEEIKRESIWRPKDRVNSHYRESLKTALPYRWNWSCLLVQLCLFYEQYCPPGDDLVSRKYIYI